MYRIAVCDNDRHDLSVLQKMAEALLDRHGIDYRLSAFDSHQRLFASWNRQAYHLLILDIRLDGADGIELAKKLRGQQSDAGIIFVTAYPEYALRGYCVQPIQYLLKPVQPEELENAIRTHYELHFSPKTLIVKAKSGTCVIPLRDISYIEVFGHVTTIHAASGPVECSAKLSELEQRLNAMDFIRCHKSYLVNLRHIRYIKRYEVYLGSGGSIPVGKARYSGVQSAFIRFHDSDGNHIYI